MNEAGNLNMRYYNGDINDDIPYTGVINYDEKTGLFYDEDGDVVDMETINSFCDCEKGDEGNE